MEAPEQAISLGVQLGVTAGFVLAMTVIHALGLVATSRLLRLDADRLKEHDFDARAVILMAALGLSLFVLHFIEILIFAVFYLYVGVVESVEDALQYSASAYSTLGLTSEYVPADWRLIGTMEALVGFILIGWSTAFMVGKMDKLTR